MYSISERSLHSIGFGTIILYLLSLTFFLLGALYPSSFIPGIVLGALFFFIPSVILGLMVKQRINT